MILSKQLFNVLDILVLNNFCPQVECMLASFVVYEEPCLKLLNEALCLDILAKSRASMEKLLRMRLTKELRFLDFYKAWSPSVQLPMNVNLHQRTS